MNEWDDPRKLPIAKAVITHRARGFRNKAAVPVTGIESVADLDVFDPVLGMIKETAVTDNHLLLAAPDDCKLRRNAGAIPAHDFLDESDGLFALGKNAQREAHEIGIRKQLRHTLNIFLAE